MTPPKPDHDSPDVHDAHKVHANASVFLDAFGDSCDRRLFLKRFAFGVAGLAGFGALGLDNFARAKAVPFVPPEEGVVLGDESCALRISGDLNIAKSAYTAYPTLALDDAAERVWTTWVDEEANSNAVMLRAFDAAARTWTRPQQASAAGDGEFAYQPQIAMGRGHIVLVWTHFARGARRLAARAFQAETGQWGNELTLAGASGADVLIVMRPALAPLPDGGFLLAWEEKRSASAPFTIRCAILDGELGIKRTFDPAKGLRIGDACRPSLAVSPDGATAALVFDAYEGGGTTNVNLTLFSTADGGVLAQRRVTDHPATDLAPAAAFSPDGALLWIGWHSNRKGDNEWDMPRWFQISAYNAKKDSFYQPVWPPPMMDLDKQREDQGFEFTRLAVAADGTLCVTGRPSHRFCLQTYRGGSWSPLYRFPVEGWGGRGQNAPALFDAKGRLWVARRDIGANVLECVEGIGGGNGQQVEPELHPMASLQPVAVPMTLQNRREHLEFPVIKPPSAAADDVKESAEAPWNIYFGDVHGHSWMSDGMGDIDEGFRRARDVFADDFYALTDHDNFVGRKVLHAEYEEQKAIVDHFNEPGRFATLFAQEWTTPRVGVAHGFGHKNLYSATPDHPLFDHKDPRHQDTPDLFAALKQRGMIAIPHHVGWTGVDWENHDPDTQPLMEVCSIHGAFEYFGNEPIPHRGGIPGNFIQDGLNRGLRFGFVGGSDQHGLIHQHGIGWTRMAYRAGLTGVLARELTRESIFDALRKRRAFATSGVKLRPVLTVAGLMMGEEGEISAPPRLQCDVLALDRIRWITIVRNGEDLVRYGGEGTRSRFSFLDAKIPENRTSYYYLRVQLDDGNMAWTSPTWVTPKA